MMAFGLRLVVTGCIGTLLLGCGGDFSEPATPTGAATTAAIATATATPTPTATATPVTLENAEGPLFYYIDDPHRQPFLVAVDVASGVEVARTPLERNTTVILSSRGQLVSWDAAPTDVVERNADGSLGRVLYYSPVAIHDGAFSASGEMLALVLARTGVVVLDAQTGHEIVGWNDEALPPVPEGYPWQLQWMADSDRVVADLGIDRGGCGPGHLVLTLKGQASFIQEDGCNTTSPDGELMADPGIYGCMLVGDDTVRIIEAGSGDEVSRYVEDRAVLTPWEWSPDSRELLIRRMVVPDEYNPRDPAEDCAFQQDEALWASASWLLMQTNGEVAPADGVAQLFERWYPERRVQLRCEFTIEEVLRTRGDTRVARCPDSYKGTLLVDGAPIGESPSIEVLGFVER